MKIKIRKFRQEDAEAVSALIKNNFMKLDMGGHTKEGLRLQIEGNSPDNLIKRSKDVCYFVSTGPYKITGICGYDKEKIHTLFVDIPYQNKGIGKHLLEKILQEAKNDGLKSIIIWSIFFAQGFYQKYGFKRLREISFPEETRDIILIEMEMILLHP